MARPPRRVLVDRGSSMSGARLGLVSLTPRARAPATVRQSGVLHVAPHTGHPPVGYNGGVRLVEGCSARTSAGSSVQSRKGTRTPRRDQYPAKSDATNAQTAGASAVPGQAFEANFSFPEATTSRGVDNEDVAREQPPKQRNMSPASLQETITGNGAEPKHAVRLQPARPRKPSTATAVEGPLIMMSRPLPKVLVLHTGGTLGMDPEQSYVPDEEAGSMRLRSGTGGNYGALRPGAMLSNLLNAVPELKAYANLHLAIPYNLDSSRVGPTEWIRLARLLNRNREDFDAFLIVHGTDTMAYTASALSLMLAGFRKPIVLTGSQLPLTLPRSDARQNLIDSLTCATAFFNPPHVRLQEVAVCFGGHLLRGNRAQKVTTTSYRAFDSLTYPALAVLGVDVDWRLRYLLQVEGVYRPRFRLDPRVLRVPIVPGCDPRAAYGDLAGRGVKGIIVEAFGVGNMPDLAHMGWLPWLRAQRKKGLKVLPPQQ